MTGMHWISSKSPCTHNRHEPFFSNKEINFRTLSRTPRYFKMTAVRNDDDDDYYNDVIVIVVTRLTGLKAQTD